MEVTTGMLLVSAGIASGVISLIDPIPYIRDTLRGATRPHRGTWLIWSVLGTVAFASQAADGGTWSLVMVGVQATTITFTFLLSLRFGQGALTHRERVLVGIAAIGVLGWVASSDPTIATVCIVLADLIGVAMMIPKTWRDPWSETRSMYVLAALAGALSAVAVGRLDPALLVYPVYFAVAEAVIAGVITLRRHALSRTETLTVANAAEVA